MHTAAGVVFARPRASSGSIWGVVEAFTTAAHDWSSVTKQPEMIVLRHHLADERI